MGFISQGLHRLQRQCSVGSLYHYITTCGTPGGGECAKQSFYAGVTLNGSYRLIQTEQWLAGLGLNIDAVFHEKNIGPSCCTTDGRDYNLISISPSAFGRYFFAVAAGSQIMPSSLGMTYSFLQDWLHITGSGLIWHTHVNTWKWDVSIDPIRQARLGLSYSLSLLDFNPTQSLSARNATAHAVGLTGSYSFQGGLRTVTLGYQYGTSDANSKNFEVNYSNGVKAELKSRVYGPLWLVLNAGATWEDYSGFKSGFIPAPGRKWQRIENYGAQLLYTLTRHIQLDLFYNYTGWSANQRQFEAHRNNGGMGATYRF